MTTSGATPASSSTWRSASRPRRAAFSTFAGFGRVVRTALAAAGPAALRIVGFVTLLLEARPVLGRQSAGFQRLADGATRFGHMPAVAEATGFRDGDDVLELVTDSVARPLDLHLPDPELTHAGRIDEERSAGHDDQLPVGRRVAAPGVALPHVPGALGSAADQRVDQRRLAHARHPDQRQRLAGGEPRPEPVEPQPAERAGED